MGSCSLWSLVDSSKALKPRFAGHFARCCRHAACYAERVFFCERFAMPLTPFLVALMLGASLAMPVFAGPDAYRSPGNWVDVRLDRATATVTSPQPGAVQEALDTHGGLVSVGLSLSRRFRFLADFNYRPFRSSAGDERVDYGEAALRADVALAPALNAFGLVGYGRLKYALQARANSGFTSHRLDEQGVVLGGGLEWSPTRWLWLMSSLRLTDLGDLSGQRLSIAAAVPVNTVRRGATRAIVVGYDHHQLDDDQGRAFSLGDISLGLRINW